MPFDMMRRKSPSDTMPEKNFSRSDAAVWQACQANRHGSTG